MPEVHALANWGCIRRCLVPIIRSAQKSCSCFKVEFINVSVAF